MKASAFIIFFTIVISIYTLVNWYIFSHTIPAINGSFVKSLSLKVLLWTIIFAYPVGRILERFMGSFFTTFLVKIGSFWLGAMLYLILLFLFIDILRLINHYLPFSPIFSYKYGKNGTRFLRN